jgi:hypothetical protein
LKNGKVPLQRCLGGAEDGGGIGIGGSSIGGGGCDSGCGGDAL